jgi:hypothetical protein
LAWQSAIQAIGTLASWAMAVANMAALAATVPYIPRMLRRNNSQLPVC